MRKFEIGKRYYESGLTFEITNKTAKTITYKVIQHAGRYNERVVKEGRAKLCQWPAGEVFMDNHGRTIEA